MCKVCTKCRRPKDSAFFHSDSVRKDGLSPWCKSCANENQRKCDRKRNLADPSAYLLRSKRADARAKGIQFDLEPEDVKVPLTCPILGIELEIAEGRGGRDASPSLDRLDPSKGYVKGNVAVISLKANRIKNNATGDEVMAVAKWMKQKGL